MVIHIDESVEGWFDFEDVYDLAVQTIQNGGTFVECGAYQGRSIIYLALKMLESKKKFKIYAIDDFSYGAMGLPNNYKILLNNLRKYGVDHVVEIIPNNGLDFRCKADWVFLDCAYDGQSDAYNAEKKLIDHWVPQIKSGGYIGGHDYVVYEDIRRAVDEKFPTVTCTKSSWYCKL